MTPKQALPVCANLGAVMAKFHKSAEKRGACATKRKYTVNSLTGQCNRPCAFSTLDY